MGAAILCFDASPTLSAIPTPPLSDEARDLLRALIGHALEHSPDLRQLDHRLAVPQDDETVRALLKEIQEAGYPLPVAGGFQGVLPLDRARVSGGEVAFAINETYAAFVVATGVTSACGRVAASTARLPEVTPREHSLLLEAVRYLFEARTTAWNFHASQALRDRADLLPPKAFGLPEVRTLIQKLESTL